MKRLSRSVYTPISSLNNSLLIRLHKNDGSLVRIVFSSRNLGGRGVDALTQALLANTNLRELDLSSNSIGAEGARCIASLLRHQAMTTMAVDNDSREGVGIRTLKLCDNNLRDVGVREMAAALESNVMLEDLWLDDNYVGATALAALAEALRRNTRLRRLHLRHNSFQSLSPLIECAFDKRSLNDVASSNHTLCHVFLNCGYAYECDELEAILRINRLGRTKARGRKIAMFLEGDLGGLLRTELDPRLVHRLLGILAQHGSVSTLFRVMSHLPSDVLAFRGVEARNALFADDPVDVDDSMEVESFSL